MNSQNLQKLSIGLLVLLLLATASFIFWRNQQSSSTNTPSSTETSLAPTSGTPLGILITDPNYKAIITSPLLIKGSASTDNFPDNKISFKLIDANNQVIAEGQSPRGEEQASGHFNFEAQIEFQAPSPGLGYIIINDNPQSKFAIQF